MVPNLLIKFIDGEYINNFVENGQIYFKQNKYFRKLESEDKDTIKGDRLEGHRVTTLDPTGRKFFIRKLGDTSHPFHLKNITRWSHNEYNKRLDNIPISCFVLINEGKQFNIEGNNFKLKGEVIEQLKEISGNRPFVLTDATLYIPRVFDYGEANNLPLRSCKVEYYPDTFEENINSEKYKKNPLDALFHKRKKYENQLEYRFVWTEETSEDKMVEIGSVEDICRIYRNVEELSDIEMVINCSE